jgi:hypothetical protein
MKEIDFYQEFSERFTKYLASYLPDKCEIAFSHNKSLDNMIAEVEQSLNCSTNFIDGYIPKLKLDVLFGVKLNSKIHLILIEAKYLKQLALKDYSQLSGYLQVAKGISTGLLLLVVKGKSPNRLSNDFNEIIQLNNLPMDWMQSDKDSNHKFQTGILTYVPGNGINWIETELQGGISNFKQLADKIIKDIST